MLIGHRLGYPSRSLFAWRQPTIRATQQPGETLDQIGDSHPSPNGDSRAEPSLPASLPRGERRKAKRQSSLALDQSGDSQQQERCGSRRKQHSRDRLQIQKPTTKVGFSFASRAELLGVGEIRQRSGKAREVGGEVVHILFGQGRGKACHDRVFALAGFVLVQSA